MFWCVSPVAVQCCHHSALIGNGNVFIIEDKFPYSSYKWCTYKNILLIIKSAELAKHNQNPDSNTWCMPWFCLMISLTSNIIYFTIKLNFFFDETIQEFQAHTSSVSTHIMISFVPLTDSDQRREFHTGLIKTRVCFLVSITYVYPTRKYPVWMISLTFSQSSVEVNCLSGCFKIFVFNPCIVSGGWNGLFGTIKYKLFFLLLGYQSEFDILFTTDLGYVFEYVCWYCLQFYTAFR